MMISKRLYIKPEVTRIALDNSIALMQVSDPDPQSSGKKGSNQKGTSDPFQSPFGDKPFS